MIFLVLIFPLCTLIILCVFSSYLEKNGVLSISVCNLSLTNLLCLFLYLMLTLNISSVYLTLNYWLSFMCFDVTWFFRLDMLSISMAYIVTSISLYVYIYSVGYMYGDPNRSMFLGYLSLFTFFMLLLVCSGNLFIFFVSWEGVGICSYLLIYFCNSRVLVSQSVIKALLVNKISNLFLLIGILISIALIGYVTLNVSSLVKHRYVYIKD